MRNAGLLILLCCSLAIAAQQKHTYTFRYLDTSHGLLHNNVLGISQDTKGFMWILTVKGLQRYDGSRFINYPEVVNNSSVTLMTGTQLFVDNSLGTVNVIKWDSIEQLNLSTNKITTRQTDDIILSQGDPFQTFSDPYQFTWRISEDGIIGIKAGQEQQYKALNFRRTWNQSSFMAIDSLSRELWMPFLDRLMLFELKSGQVHTSKDTGHHPLLDKIHDGIGSYLRMSSIMRDSDGNIYILLWDPTHMFLKFDARTHEVKTFSLLDVLPEQYSNARTDSTIFIFSMFEDRQKQIWIATDRAGLIRYDRYKDNFEFIVANENLRNGVKYNFSIRAIFQDRDDNIWLGTDNGVSMFNPYKSYFTSVYDITDKSNSLSNFELTDVIETSSGQILVSSWGGGISVFDHEWKLVKTLKFSGSFKRNQVWSFVEANDGMIWAGAQNGYLHIYDPGTGATRTLRPPEAHGSTIRAMTKDGDGNIILGLQNGRIAIWDAHKKEFFAYGDQAGSIPSTFSPIVNIQIDDLQRCWVSTEVDLREFDLKNRIFSGTYSLANRSIMMQGIESYNDTTLLVGTTDRGLFLFHTTSGTFSQKGIPDQLINTGVHAIDKYVSGQVWITTDNSVCNYSPEQQKVIQYQLGNDIITSQFTGCRFLHRRNGDWLTQTYSEIVSYCPDKINDEISTVAPVEICGLHVSGRMLSADSLQSIASSLKLPYDQNFLTIDFSLLDYSKYQQPVYSYRLTGINKDWVTTEDKSAHYSDIKPGDYLFLVKAQIGDKTTEITSFQIIITPPWYGTWLFRLTCFTLVVIALFALMKSRIKTIRKESHLKHRIAEMEMMALRAQMNPHFIFNCINSIDAMIQGNDKYRATTYLNKFAKLIRNILDSSATNKVPLSKDMETLRLYVELEHFRHEKKFVSEFNIDDELLQSDYKVPPLIIQPYVENAILHGLRNKTGNQGLLQVSVFKSEDHLLFRIEDNGVGRHSANGGTTKFSEGYGLQLSSDRIRLFNNEDIASVHITDLVENGNPSGTRVEVKLKIS